MRAALRRKLGSQRGASLLLALLFLLICSMVSASILMAAVSNAGKHRSNLEEHQTYLALSSAVSLLCDELNAAEYKGKYTYTIYTYTVEDSEGNEVTVTERYLDRETGEYTGALSSILRDNFDALFAESIPGSPAVTGFNRVNPGTLTVSPTHTLTLTPDTGTDLDERPVQITLEVKESYAMYLTAELDGCQIRAELTPTQSKPALPGTLSLPGTYTTDPMKWKIGWITAEGEEGSS